MGERRSILEERHIEFDGLAIIMIALAFAGVAAATVWLAGSSAQRFDAPVWLSGGAVGAAVIAAWIVGYPRRAAMPAMAMVVLLAILLLPRLFNMNGALLREATGTPVEHLYIAMGIYIAGLSLSLLALLVFGFFIPLCGAVLGLVRQEKHARETLVLHGVLTGLALLIVLFPFPQPQVL
jgi:hypothetical protein